MLLTQERIRILNELSKAINKEYGYKPLSYLYIFERRHPRINLGPCGAFAKVFFENWNNLFLEKVKIGFFFMNKTDKCHHCFIVLPDGNFFDGGNGVFKSIYKTIKGASQESFIEIMDKYDEARLNKNSCSLNRFYEECPNYNSERVHSIINRHLLELKKLTNFQNSIK